MSSSSIKAQVLINEYSCSNLSAYADNYGNFEDWIELYNASSTAVNLNGYFLSEDYKKKNKWSFGNVSIGAKGFLRIWASGADKNLGLNLHTNFTLKQCKPDYIIFSDPSGVVLDSIQLRASKESESRGRVTDGANTWGVFSNPTPKSANMGADQEYANLPKMNPSAGFYNSAINVSMSSVDPNVSIYYTTDGSTPDFSSNLYTSPVSISSTTVLRAVSYSNNAGIPSSFVESNTYFVNESHKVAVISVFGDNLQALFSGAMSSPETGLEYFDAAGKIKTEGYGISNKHGNDSWFYNQRGIDFVCQDQYGYSYALQEKFFPDKSRSEFQRIILKAAANDNYPFEGTAGSHFPGELGGAHIRDSYVHTLSQKAGLNLDERTWAPCVLFVNGSYWGLYDLREKMDDKDFTKYYYDTKADSLQMLKTWGNTWSEYGGIQAQNDWSALSNYITTNNMAIASNYNYVDNLYNFKSLADYTILNSYTVCSDWLNWNTLWWRGLNASSNKKKWRYGLWDEDATFHHYINYTVVPNTDVNANPCDPESLGDPGGEGHIPILNALLKNPDFKKYYVMRYFDLINTGLSCKRMTDVLDSMVNLISPEMPEQINKWGGTMSEWQTNVSDLRNFILQRCDTVVKKFNSCYNVTGPYSVKVNVDPPGSGVIDLNSINIKSFVWSGKYPGNMDINLIAHPNSNYCFLNWEIKNNNILPDKLDTSIFINLHANDSIIAHFVYNPKPIISPINPLICKGKSISLHATGGNNFLWLPTSGLSCSSCANPIASPSLTTVYTITTASSSGCLSKSTEIITVIPDALASFTESLPSFAIPSNMHFTNTSTQATNYLWIFDNNNTSAEKNPSHIFISPGTQTVTLIAYGANACNDTIRKTYTFTDTTKFSLPNVFSPNDDGLNDYFEVSVHDLLELNISIFDRWGSKVYEFKDTADRWDGKNSSGKICEEGTYYYVLQARDKMNKVYNTKGFFQLLR